MNPERETRLLELAEAVSDRQPVPWVEERAAAGELHGVVVRLESLHALAGAFADIRPPGDPDDYQRILGRWGQLELIAKLGEGAFGEVFRARDPNLGRDVALKLRRAGPGSAGEPGRRLLDEARRLARIRHPNVVAVHGADLCDGRAGIWTELIEGQTLEERLRIDGPVGPGEAIALGLDLCKALAAVHAAGLVHGDVKTANVLRERGGRIVLTDLGSSTEAGQPAITGSPATLAPEVLAGGPATPAADLYSLGMLLFRMLSGRYPADAAATPNARDLRRSLRDLRPELPLELVRVVEKATDPDPERRFPSAGALEQTLALLGGVARAPEPAASRVPGGRRVVIAVAAAATALLAVTVASLAIRNRPQPEGATVLQAQHSAATEPAPSVPGPTAAVEPAAAPAAGAPAAARPLPLAVRATMFRASENGEQPLHDGDRVKPGDRLFLELRAEEQVHAWVVNEDLDGQVFVLFPIAGLELANPLPGGRLHRLPGRMNGKPQEWQVTSAGGRERFLLIAARGELPELERELAGLAAARSDDHGTSRGVGGLAAAPAAGRGRLDTLATRLTADRQRDGSVWFERLELENP